ncbi:MAG: hypothetical protein LKJ94_02665 [Candidatus Methanomethylophilus sp.]|nr:hypothetical protein [Methanomethylophilus sp.]
MINVDGSFKKKMIESLERMDFPRKSIDDIFDNACQILSRCPDPHSERAVSRKGLMFGRVQSGKTSNFLSLVALSFDNGFPLAVILGGTKKDLVGQNYFAAREYFSNQKDNALAIYNCKDIKEYEANTIAHVISKGRKVIIVALKNSSQIGIVRKVLDLEELRSLPALIIDDEGDQATPNAKVRSNKESSTYATVMGLSKYLKRSTFLTVTATPQANFLISIMDELSPDFVTLTSPGEGYCGLNVFHGSEQERYIREIKIEERDDLLEKGIPASFKQAMSDFFVGAAICRCRGGIQKFSMLVHPSQHIKVHEEVAKKVKKILDYWQSLAADYLSGEPDISFEFLRKLFVKSYNDFKTTCEEVPPYDSLEKEIVNCIDDCSPQAWICNGKQDEMNRGKEFDLNIYIGGDLLQRGMVIKNLTVTYIPRRAKKSTTIDTTEQRARWFGYRESYLDVCRIYMTLKMQRDYNAIRISEEDLWETMEDSISRGIPLKNVPRMIKIPVEDLKPTRSNVAPTRGLILGSGWIKTSVVPLSVEYNEFNFSLSEKIKEKFHPIKKSYDSGGYQMHSVSKNHKFSEISVDFLDKLFLSPRSVLNKNRLREYKSIFNKSEIDPPIDVVWIRDGCNEKRQLFDDGTFSGLFQGRNEGTNYPGDGKITFIDGMNEISDRTAMILQVHTFSATVEESWNKGMVFTALAIYVPPCIADKCGDLYVPKDSKVGEINDGSE